MMSRSLPRQTSGSRAGSVPLRRRVAVPLAAVVSASCCWSLPTLTFAHPEIDAQLAHVSGEIARSPESAELYLQRGHLHRVHRDWQKGLADFRQAAELDPDLHSVDRAIGRLYLEADKPQQALAQLEQFLARQPGDPDGLILRGRALGEISGVLPVRE